MERPPAYSADVNLLLIVGERQFALSQIGPDDIVVQHPSELPPCDAELIMQLDGERHNWLVTLVDGMSATSPVVRIADR
ncbi:MAG: hypothetical protein MJE77_27650 [Proteobacteria bacterium]|nr:hypothetical protein [Pseudomonadota bacterium]